MRSPLCRRFFFFYLSVGTTLSTDPKASKATVIRANDAKKARKGIRHYRCRRRRRHRLLFLLLHDLLQLKVRHVFYMLVRGRVEPSCA